MEAKRLVFGMETHPVQVSYTTREILRAAYQKLGIDLEFRELPRRRALMMAEAGELDGESVRVKGFEAAHPTLMPVPVPIGVASARLYSKQADLRIRSWADLSSLRVAIPMGVVAVEHKLKDHTRITPVVNTLEALRLVAGDAVDVVIVTEIEGAMPLNLGPGVARLPDGLDPVPVYHYLHQRHADLVPKVETIMRAMEKSGEIARITRASAANAARR